MEPPKTTRQMQQLMGKVGYIRRFIPALSELVGPMRELLKENNEYVWEKRHQEVFERIKKAVASTPTMSPPVKSIPLRLYLAVSQHAINGLIAQEVQGTERPVSYLSKMLKDVETSSITGRVSRWSLLLSEYDIQLVQPHKLGCQALAEMMALCSNQCKEDISENIRGGMPEVNECHIQKEEWWAMNFDGTPSSPARGAGLKGEYGVKETSLAMYKDKVLRLIDLFKEVRMSDIPRAENRHADALATIGSKEVGRASEGIVAFKKIAKPSLSIVPHEDEPANWRKPILSQFKQKVFTKVTRHLP
ncbi:Ribonuclease H superfamily [Sesbania bispinosa]|nr:Ribonuclease H superfamily [Sesbania bispinosa]